MRLVVDAVAVRSGSAAIVIGNLLNGWSELAPQDEVTVLVDGRADFDVPQSVMIESLITREASALERAWARSHAVRQACIRLRAEGLLSAVTASAFLGAPCPRGVIVYDLRHELRPEQFSLQRRVSRRLLYGWSFRHADALFCISERTRNDLIAHRRELAQKAHVALLGADHARNRRPPSGDSGSYVLAFGHFANKNVDCVLAAWQRYSDERNGLALRVCGLGPTAREAVERKAAELGIQDSVELLPWLSDEDFGTVFAGAAAILFPSDFEGFGLPAVEALLLGIPVVISSDPALLEVTGGHALVAAGDDPGSLAQALGRALDLGPQERSAGIEHALEFTWRRTAASVREVMARLAARHAQMPVSST